MIQIIRDGFAGLLYENGVLIRVLEPGRHVFGRFFAPQRDVKTVDLRERSTTIKNQEILTADKVAVRLSLLVYFKVTDPKAAVRNVENFEDRMYEDVQLAARRFLATRSLDQIFKDRNEISDAIRQDLKASALDYGVEVRRADVKDIVFPGNLREIMNRVIETERTTEAQAVQARRGAEIARLQAENAAQVARIEAESKAATSALALASEAQAAELAAARPELLKLKELEILKEIGRHGEHRFYVGVDKLSAKG
ncbi:MAG TPA: slipin family protein [Planctomycetota bacterium]